MKKGSSLLPGGALGPRRALARSIVPEVDDRGTDLLGDADEALLQHLGHSGSGCGLPRRSVDGPYPGEPGMGKVTAGGADHHRDDDEDDTQHGPAHGVHTLAGRADDIDRRPRLSRTPLRARHGWPGFLQPRSLAVSLMRC